MEPPRAGLAVAAVTGGRMNAEGAVQQRVLGRTGEKVSCLGVGGSHIGESPASITACRKGCKYYESSLSQL
jgi:hypothetical protein